MGENSAAEIDAWLRGGGLVVTSSDRAARAIASAFHRDRQADGLAAWPAPSVLDWHSFAHSAWIDHSPDARLLLSSAQERSLWEGIIAASGNSAALLPGPRHSLAAMAMDAHNLLCSYAPRFLQASARAGWQQDAAEFSDWLSAFDSACRSDSLLSASRLPLELIPLLEANQSQRPPLLLAGFDRLLPMQREFFNAWGIWRDVTPETTAVDIGSFAVSDAQAELAACAQWCSHQLHASPDKRLLIIAPDVTARRGEIERAFLKYIGPSASTQFEFSLGIPLTQVALARSAQLLLHWLTGALEEHELDWLFSTGYAAASTQESAALQALMRALRRRGLQRTRWSLKAFASQRPGAERPPLAWVQRMIAAQRLLETPVRHNSPIEWSALVPRVLEAAGWPGARPLSSAEFQAAKRWQQAVDVCGSLGFDGRRIDWKGFLSELDRSLNETLFALESQDAPILIAGPAEAAGLTADAIWFLGAGEDAWPARGAMLPLLPIDAQREAGMPHATSQLDWELARSITARLLASAPEVRFSYAIQTEGVETRPSRLVAQFAGPTQPLPPELAPESSRPQLTICVADASRIPLTVTSDDNSHARSVPGGSNVLSSQSQCPFKAFATARLAAQDWQPAETGLTASMRGQLLHAVLHSIWSGPPAGIRSLDDLAALPDRRSFVAGHVQAVLRDEMPAAAREQMPPRYLELEEKRLTRLLTEWLEYESTRQPFEVVDIEAQTDTSVGGLHLRLRLDRIDRLNDGSLLVIDYKTGDVSPKSWELPRPDDVQLPLYAQFALESREEPLGGLVFAKVRPGDHSFTGRVGDAQVTLLDNLSPKSALVKDALVAEQLMAWKDAIEQLARDFLSGRADVDPRVYPDTCKRCGLQTLCRIQENHDASSEEDDDENSESADE
jgi:probable DNA repair protein